jgi:uncharacterized YigZ family protein
VTSYLTIARDAHGEVEVKSSRFRCTLQRVSSEEDARALVAALRKEHWDARHHCSAFVLGSDSALQRSSDDGEPAGTAGAPMLEVLRGAGVSDVAAVVTRWFGGTLLGAGGLVRAYGDAVRTALDQAGTLRRDLVTEFAIALDHGSAGRVESELRARGLVVLDAAYGDRVRLVVGSTTPDSVGPLVAEVTAGAATAERIGERWVDAR